MQNAPFNMSAIQDLLPELEEVMPSNLLFTPPPLPPLSCARSLFGTWLLHFTSFLIPFTLLVYHQSHDPRPPWQFWPSLVAPDQSSFWQHESAPLSQPSRPPYCQDRWIRHGTCAEKIFAVPQKEHAYFRSLLRLLETLPSCVLKQSQARP
eukprot:752528-Hanusia_phi.AAC.3